MSNFAIHPQLLTDCHLLGRISSGHLLLHRNAVIPWFILVPDTEYQDLLDLPDDVREELMTDAKCVAKFIKTHFGLSKINVFCHRWWPGILTNLQVNQGSQIEYLLIERPVDEARRHGIFKLIFIQPHRVSIGELP